MPHNRLKLVVNENSAAPTVGTAEPLVVAATPDPEPQRLRLVDPGEPPFPDDAA
jgi:hypothetical protein